jgi:uncharacterized protein YceK
MKVNQAIVTSFFLPFLVAISGCASFWSAYQGDPKFMPCDHYFRATKYNVQAMSDSPFYLQPFLVIDLPFSMVGDTIISPLALMGHEFGKGYCRDGTMDQSCRPLSGRCDNQTRDSDGKK